MSPPWARFPRREEAVTMIWTVLAIATLLGVAVSYLSAILALFVAAPPLSWRLLTDDGDDADSRPLRIVGTLLLTVLAWQGLGALLGVPWVGVPIVFGGIAYVVVGRLRKRSLERRLARVV
jgi:hypothetical protein